MNLALRTDILAKNCPKNCPERSADCHVSCPRYKNYRKALETASAEEHEKMIIQGVLKPHK